jgi:hypothetical protein
MATTAPIQRERDRCGAKAGVFRREIYFPGATGRLAEHEVSTMQHRLRLQIGAVALIAAAALSSVSAFAGAPGYLAPHLIPTATQSPQVTATRPTQATCFFRRAWDNGWRATPDARAIYIRVANTIYRLDLQSSYSLLKDPFATLINRGTADTICRPLDLRLTVSNRAGIVQWPIVKEITRLTPDEAAALPRKLRP